MIDLDTFQRLKDAIESKQRDADRALGQLEQLNKRLAEFGCQSIKDAETMLAKLGQEKQEMERQFGEELDACEREFGQLLDGA